MLIYTHTCIYLKTLNEFHMSSFFILSLSLSFVRKAFWMICEFVFKPVKWNLLFAFRAIYSLIKNTLPNICCILTRVTRMFVGLFVHEKFSWLQTEDLFHDNYNLRQHMYTIVLVLGYYYNDHKPLHVHALGVTSTSSGSTASCIKWLVH